MTVAREDRPARSVSGGTKDPDSRPAGSLGRFSNNVFKGVLKTAIRFTEDFLGYGQIHLGALDADMAHIGGQKWKFVLRILAVLIPLIQPVNGEAVTQVVQAGTMTLGLCQTTTDKKMSEILFDKGWPEPAFPAAKEGQLWARQRMKLLSSQQVRLQSFRHGRRERDKPLFMKLRFPKGEDVFIEVDVFDVQTQGLAQTESAGIDQKEHGFEGAGPRAVRIMRRRFGRFPKEMVDLNQRVDMRFERFFSEPRNPFGGIVVGDADSNQVVEQSTNERQPFVLGNVGEAVIDVDPTFDRAGSQLRKRPDSKEDEIGVEILGKRAFARPRITRATQSGFEFQKGGQMIFKKAAVGIHRHKREA